MIGSLIAFSTAMPCAFIATSMLPIAAPKMSAATMKLVNSGASIGATIARLIAVPVIRVTLALP